MWPAFIASITDPVMEQREDTRTGLAVGIIGQVAVTAIMLVAWSLADHGSFNSIVTGVFTPLIGIAGTVVGFYFAGEKEARRPRRTGWDQPSDRGRQALLAG